MSASMAEVLAEHRYLYGQRYGVERVEHCSCGWQTNSGTRAWEAIAAHQAEALAANGYGELEDAWAEGHERGFWNGRLSQITSYDTPDPLIGAVDAEASNPYRRPE